MRRLSVHFARASRLLAALLLLGAAASAQQISFSGPVGCAELLPGAPTNLKARPGDGSVTLTWDRPANGACVDTYEVTLVPLGRSGRTLGMPPQRTPEFRLQVSGLTNGEPYKFTVRAFSSKFNGGGEAAVEATPRAPAPLPQLCTRLLPPGAPSDLKATPKPGAVELCWGPPANRGCTDEYRIEARAVQQGRGFMAGAPLFLALQTGGCTDIGQLQPGVLYEFKVTTFSQLWSTGEAATVRARPL